MQSSTQPIGIYDSGIGGLTVLRALQAAFPKEHFVYFADTANLPYGDKSPEEILGFSTNIIEWMTTTQQVKLVVAACNTSSAIALDVLKNQIKTPLVGTILPLLKEIKAQYLHRSFGILATPASIKSRTHERLLREAGIQGSIESIACPLFVPLIEAGRLEDQELLEAARLYLQPFASGELDTLIFGCTHYPWIKPLIQQHIPATITLLDPAHAMVNEVQTLLNTHHLQNQGPEMGTTSFYCSENPKHFGANASRCLSKTIHAELVFLSNSTLLSSKS